MYHCVTLLILFLVEIILEIVSSSPTFLLRYAFTAILSVGVTPLNRLLVFTTLSSRLPSNVWRLRIYSYFFSSQSVSYGLQYSSRVFHFSSRHLACFVLYRPTYMVGYAYRFQQHRTTFPTKLRLTSPNKPINAVE